MLGSDAVALATPPGAGNTPPSTPVPLLTSRKHYLPEYIPELLFGSEHTNSENSRVLQQEFMILTRSLILDFRTRLLLVSKGIGVDGGEFPAPGGVTRPAASLPSK